MWDMVSTRGGEISVFIDVQLSVCKFLNKGKPSELYYNMLGVPTVNPEASKLSKERRKHIYGKGL